MKNARVWDATAFSSSWRTRGSTFFFIIRRWKVTISVCFQKPYAFESPWQQHFRSVLDLSLLLLLRAARVCVRSTRRPRDGFC